MSKARLWTRDFIIITLINFFSYFAFQLFPTALPPYIKTLGASDSIVGWLNGILTFAALIARPFAGIVLDRYGRKGVFIVGIVGMFLTTGALYFFPFVGVILLIRFIHGLTWGIANTSCGTVASDNIEKSRFAEGIGFFSLATSIGMAMAPAVALTIGLNNSITLALVFLSVSFILILIMRYEELPKPEGGAKKKVSPYARESIIPSVIMALITITYGSVVTFLALYAGEKSISGIGLFFTVYAVTMLISRPLLGKLVDRRGFGAGVWPGVASTTLALILLFFSNSLPMFLVCGALYGIGLGAALSSLQTMAITSVPKARTGAANATFFTGFDGGIGLGAVLAGFLASFLGYGGMFASVSIFPVLAGILYFITSRRKKAISRQDEQGR